MEKITQSYMELIPAYGRNYKTKKEVEQAFLEGKDFEGDMTIGFKLCSVRDFQSGVKVNLRYKNQTMVTVVKVP